MPSILLLLCGFFAGPVLGVVDPDDLFDEALFPFVSIAVAIILFEGGLSLRIADLRDSGTVIRKLMTIGVVSSSVLCAGGAFYVAGMPMAVLLGAVLVVTGPTVIGPDSNAGSSATRSGQCPLLCIPHSRGWHLEVSSPRL